ncbi:MAG: glycosyltransferase [Bacteroidia bacterium]|nr:glycosyltransferase [Bacteroidia bacterium]MCF8445926.1 glycosyltransferase [Bacteroidia bacterium]
MAKICIISPSLKLGGIERALTTLAIEFFNKGHDVHFITCLKADHFFKLPNLIPITEPNFLRSNSFNNKISYYPKLIYFIRKEVMKINPDRVLVFGDLFCPIVLLALLNSKYQVYISDRTIPNYKFKFPIPQLKKMLYPLSAGFIAQTERSYKYKESIFGNKIRMMVIPNALKEIQFDVGIQKGNQILYAGRFAWEKDPEILIKSMPYVLEHCPDWILKMAGTGPLLEPMKTLAKKLGVSENVKFVGKVSNVGDLYAESSLLVLPSIVEGFPNTLIEAMAMGIPTICFQDIPFEDIIKNGVNGVVLNDRKFETLGNAIVEIIQNIEKTKLISLNAIEVKEKFESKKISQEFLIFMGI